MDPSPHSLACPNPSLPSVPTRPPPEVTYRPRATPTGPQSLAFTAMQPHNAAPARASPVLWGRLFLCRLAGFCHVCTHHSTAGCSSLGGRALDRCENRNVCTQLCGWFTGNSHVRARFMIPSAVVAQSLCNYLPTTPGCVHISHLGTNRLACGLCLHLPSQQHGAPRHPDPGSRPEAPWQWWL